MEFFQQLHKLTQRLLYRMQELEQKLEGMQGNHTIEPRQYVSSKWVMEHLGISKSTLADYRKRGIIPYTYFEDRKKVFYKLTDIYEILDNNYQGRIHSPR